MKYVDEFRDQKLVSRLSAKIKRAASGQEINFMEVCGTHTHNFLRFGLDRLIPDNIRLLAGPGCPVCVSSQEYIDRAIILARKKDTILLTFGDMLRVPGTNSRLELERARGAQVRVVYSPLESISTAKENPGKKIVFLGVGFETTAPAVALTIQAAQKAGLKNASFLVSLKLITPAMRQLLADERVRINGFLCPGHVSTIIGTRPYAFIPKKYKIGCCVAGFEPLDILEGIYFLLEQVKKNRPRVQNQYSRVVREQGNPRALKIIAQTFEPYDAQWRGLGVIPKSGLKIRKEYSAFDAERIFPFKPATGDRRPATRCRCAEVLKGLFFPRDCPLFAKICTPDNPVGPCMVSSEGACNAYYRYR